MQWPRGRGALVETFETDNAEIRGGKAVPRRGGRCQYLVLARVHLMGSPLRTSTGPFSLLPKTMRSAPVIVPARATCASGRPYGRAYAMQCSESSSLDSNLSFGIGTRIAVELRVKSRCLRKCLDRLDLATVLFCYL